MSEMCGWLVGLPAPAPACMCGVEGSRPQPLTQASALFKKKQKLGIEARAALTIFLLARVRCTRVFVRERTSDGMFNNIRFQKI